jgi:hypothetical protein
VQSEAFVWQDNKLVLHVFKLVWVLVALSTHAVKVFLQVVALAWQAAKSLLHCVHDPPPPPQFWSDALHVFNWFVKSLIIIVWFTIVAFCFVIVFCSFAITSCKWSLSIHLSLQCLKRCSNNSVFILYNLFSCCNIAIASIKADFSDCKKKKWII